MDAIDRAVNALSDNWLMTAEHRKEAAETIRRVLREELGKCCVPEGIEHATNEGFVYCCRKLGLL